MFPGLLFMCCVLLPYLFNPLSLLISVVICDCLPMRVNASVSTTLWNNILVTPRRNKYFPLSDLYVELFAQDSIALCDVMHHSATYDYRFLLNSSNSYGEIMKCTLHDLKSGVSSSAGLKCFSWRASHCDIISYIIIVPLLACSEYSKKFSMLIEEKQIKKNR